MIGLWTTRTICTVLAFARNVFWCEHLDGLLVKMHNCIVCTLRMWGVLTKQEAIPKRLYILSEKKWHKDPVKTALIWLLGTKNNSKQPLRASQKDCPLASKLSQINRGKLFGSMTICIEGDGACPRGAVWRCFVTAFSATGWRAWKQVVDQFWNPLLFWWHLGTVRQLAVGTPSGRYTGFLSSVRKDDSHLHQESPSLLLPRFQWTPYFCSIG